jgi:RNA polymerase-associated protein LEO1
MSDAAISDDEVNDLATPAANEEELEAPRDTVEESGLGDEDDDDDLFGDGDDADADAEEPP